MLVISFHIKMTDTISAFVISGHSFDIFEDLRNIMLGKQDPFKWTVTCLNSVNYWCLYKILKSIFIIIMDHKQHRPILDATESGTNQDLHCVKQKFIVKF